MFGMDRVATADWPLIAAVPAASVGRPGSGRTSSWTRPQPNFLDPAGDGKVVLSGVYGDLVPW